MSQQDKMELLESLVNRQHKTFIELLQIRNLAKDLELEAVKVEAQKMIDMHLKEA